MRGRNSEQQKAEFSDFSETKENSSVEEEL
jgi:hypothetical protein